MPDNELNDMERIQFKIQDTLEEYIDEFRNWDLADRRKFVEKLFDIFLDT